MNPSDAYKALRELLDGQRKEQRDGESDCTVEGNGQEGTAGRQLVSCKDEDTDGDEDDDLAGHEERGHVEAAQVGAL